MARCAPSQSSDWEAPRSPVRSPAAARAAPLEMASRAGSERPIRRACTPGSTTLLGGHGDVQNFGHIDDPAFVEIVDNTGAAFVTAILDFGLPAVHSRQRSAATPTPAVARADRLRERARPSRS